MLGELNREAQTALINFERAESKMRIANEVRIYRGEDIRGAGFTRVLADLAGRGIVPSVSRTKTRIRLHF